MPFLPNVLKYNFVYLKIVLGRKLDILESIKAWLKPERLQYVSDICLKHFGMLKPPYCSNPVMRGKRPIKTSAKITIKLLTPAYDKFVKITF